MDLEITEHAREIVQNLDECLNLDELAEALIEETRAFGVDKVVAGVHRVDGRSQSPLLRTIFFNTYPDEWTERYGQQKHDLNDPVVRRIQSGSGLQSVSWSADDLYRFDEEKAARVMNEARDFRIASGHSVSTDLLSGDGVSMSFVGSHALDLGPNDRTTLMQVGAHTLHRAYLLARQREKIGLTARQIQYLNLAAEGMSDDEIGEHMNITHAGAVKNQKLIRQKLGAKSKSNAVYLAMRLGLIR